MFALLVLDTPLGFPDLVLNLLDVQHLVIGYLRLRLLKRAKFKVFGLNAVLHVYHGLVLLLF